MYAGGCFDLTCMAAVRTSDCHKGKYKYGWASSLSDQILVFRTTPTTWQRALPRRKERPTGFGVFQSSCPSAWLTIATGAEPARSKSLKARPASTAMLRVAKYCGDIRLVHTRVCSS